MPHVAVVGGGITGLVAAYRLSREPGVEVTLLEADNGVGGKVNTVTLDGVRIELGPDSFLPRDDRSLQLCREIGLEQELVEPHDFGGWIYRRGELTRLPQGTVLGLPASLRSLATAAALSPRGRARAALDLLSPRPLRGPDVSVGSFVRRRMGAEVLERLVDPLLAGTRGGGTEEMSLAAAIPLVDAAARSHRSVILGLSGARPPSAGRPRFFAPGAGMHRFVEALEDAMPDVDIRRRTPVGSIAAAGAGLEIQTDNGSLRCDGAVVTAPSYAAAKMLHSLNPQAAALLSGIEHASSAVVNLLFPAGSVGLPDGGTGVLIPSSERMALSGCTWFSKKWPDLAAADGRVTIRCFVGRGPRAQVLELGDPELESRAVQELRSIVSLRAEPIAATTTRWEAGLPRYTVGHLDRVARIEKELGGIPFLRLAGASLRGSGIPDCIAQAEHASAAILAALRG